MKNKMILGLATIALIFASCSKDEVSNVNSNNPNALGFEVSTGKTRASVVDLDILKANTTGFGVFATSSGPAGPVFINNAAYKWASTSWAWASTSYTWPATEEYPMDFYAYFPKSSAALTPALTAEYTVLPTPGAQTDFLAARYQNVVVRPASGNVTLAFKHILSKIDFKVKAGANVTVEVQSIAVKHVAKTNTFDFANLSWLSSLSAFNSDNYYMTHENVPFNQFEGLTGDIIAPVVGASGSLMLMPQDLDGNKWNITEATISTQSYIEVVYRVFVTIGGEDVVGYTNASDHPGYEGSVAQAENYDGALYVKVGFPLGTNWEMGKAYTYIITLGDIDFSGGYLVDEHYINDVGEPVDLKVIDPEVPGPINEDKVIGFVVSVEDWDETPGIGIQ